MLKRTLQAAALIAGLASSAGAQDGSPLLGLLAEAPEPHAPEPVIEGRAFGLAEAALAAERLEDDVLVLSRIAALQQRLLETNASRVIAGAPPLLLPRRICSGSPLAAMCGHLPLTFAPASGDQP